ncbi:MAG: endonuclease/exonuclease/phosphatase family protein [Myxococcota bacterium]|nr:endonuclease/exonuclease/phosphatase family protein [Myxococcota bacterium]
MLRAILVIGVVAACASGGEPAASLPGGATRLRVMTYNVNFGIAGDRAGIEAIRGASPDLVVLQETNEMWERAIVGALRGRFPHHRFGLPTNEWSAGGMGVLSRWPIVRVDQLDTAAGPFYAWRIVVDAPGGLLQILDVHLHPPSDRGSWVVGYFTTRAVRAREARDHLSRLDLTIPTIVAGDFNEEDEGQAIAVFLAQGFTNALPRFQPDANTWAWPVAGTTLRFRLDHILHDSRFRAMAADVVAGGRSDHAPVWADLVRL